MTAPVTTLTSGCGRTRKRVLPLAVRLASALGAACELADLNLVPGPATRRAWLKLAEEADKQEG